MKVKILVFEDWMLGGFLDKVVLGCVCWNSLWVIFLPTLARLFYLATYSTKSCSGPCLSGLEVTASSIRLWAVQRLCERPCNILPGSPRNLCGFVLPRILSLPLTIQICLSEFYIMISVHGWMYSSVKLDFFSASSKPSCWLDFISIQGISEVRVSFFGQGKLFICLFCFVF